MFDCDRETLTTARQGSRVALARDCKARCDLACRSFFCVPRVCSKRACTRRGGGQRRRLRGRQRRCPRDTWPSLAVTLFSNPRTARLPVTHCEAAPPVSVRNEVERTGRSTKKKLRCPHLDETHPISTAAGRYGRRAMEDGSAGIGAPQQLGERDNKRSGRGAVRCCSAPGASRHLTTRLRDPAREIRSVDVWSRTGTRLAVAAGPRHRKGSCVRSVRLARTASCATAC